MGLASLGDMLRPDQRAQLQRELGDQVLRGDQTGGVGEAALQMAEVNCAETLAAESAHLDAVQEERAALEAQLRSLQEQMGPGDSGDSDSAFGEGVDEAALRRYFSLEHVFDLRGAAEPKVREDGGRNAVALDT